MAVVTKPYQAFPLFDPGTVECGCSSVAACLNFLSTDTISFQVGLTASDDCNCDGLDWAQFGNMSPIASGTNTSTGTALVDATKNFITLGIQAGGTCAYRVKNTTLGTYGGVSVVVNATTLTIGSSLFTATNQTYQIFPWYGGSAWTFTGGTATNVTDTTPLTQCDVRIPSCEPDFQNLLDNRMYVLAFDVVSTNSVVAILTLGGEAHTINNPDNPGVDNLSVGTHTIGFAPQFWSTQNLSLEFGFQIELDNVSLYAYSTIGIKILDCDGNTVLQDTTNAHGWITYKDGEFFSEFDARAQVSIYWPSTGLEDGCYQVCIYDLCDVTAACVLESYSIYVSSTGYNYNEDRDACELELTWTNYDDFELEQGDYLNYPEYPGYPGYQTFTQLLRTRGKVRFTGFVSDDFTLNTESDGLREIIHYEGHETYELQIELLPEPIHRALCKGLGHDVFNIDDVAYIWMDGEYQPQWKKSTDFAPVTVRVIKQYSKGENVNP